MARQGSPYSLSVQSTGSLPHTLHLLNQRYRREFDRAEALQAELNDIKASRLWPCFQSLRRWKNATRLSSAELLRDQHKLWLRHYSPYSPCPLRTGLAFEPSDVSVIIPFKDQPELLEVCLRRLCWSVPDSEIILVNNGSMQSRTKRFFPRWQKQGHHLIHDSATFNFARLCNLGANHSVRPVLLFLNNDAWPRNRNWVRAMLEPLNSPEVSIVGAKLYYPDKTLQHIGITPTGPNGVWEHAFRFSSKLPDELRQPCFVPAVTGACMMIRRDDFESVQGFDERFPTTHNDINLCQRMIAMGRKIAITPHAKLWHLESLSRGFVKEPLP